MSELISNKEALIALANGEDVEYRVEDFSNDWDCAKSLKASELISGMVEIFDSVTDHQLKYYEAYFRLKPKTIMLNGIEIPAPFEPLDGEVFWHIFPELYQGYGWCYKDDDNEPVAQFGAYRTEDEIKQVIEALRSIFKGIEK